MPYLEHLDPYWTVCDYDVEMSAFSNPFTCTRIKGHVGSHYNEYTDTYERNA